MKIHFCRSPGLSAWLIRLFTMSRWNHVAIQINSVIFQATGTSGVHVTTPETLSRHYPVIEAVTVESVSGENAQAFLVKQLGKKYDWLALVAMPFLRNWGKPDRWFCSELVAAALKAGGRPLRIEGHRVTPRDLWAAL